jgi:hypothetical protein
MKQLRRIKQLIRDHTPYLRHDSVRLAAATAVVGAALFGVYSASISQPPGPVFDEASIAARLTDTLRQEAQALAARRSGTILFVSTDKFCEEHRFDNVTGQTVAIDYVDCEERLSRETNVQPEAGKTASMKNMLASFKK